MKKGLILLVVLVLVVIVCGLKRISSPTVAQHPAVVTSGYVPYILVREIGGGLVPCEMLLAPGSEPHSFEPSPGSMVAVHKARAFVYISDKLEPWVKDVLGAVESETRVVALADGLAQTPDPHVWMDFDNVVYMARTVLQMLTQIDSSHAQVYAENFSRFSQRIADLDRDFSQKLSSCESREMVHVGHLAFGALAARYGLTLTALAGTSHDGEHSARKLAGLVEHVRAAHVKTLFSEEAVSPRLAQTVAAETGTQILPLYTVEAVSKDDFVRAVTYEELMRRNLDNLQQGLACQP